MKVLSLNDSILVTGGRGFVGKNLVRELKNLGFKDIIVPPKDCDLRIQDDVSYLFDSTEPKYVFHLAAVVGGINANLKDPYKFLYDNVIIQSNVINQAIKWGTKKFLNLGSSCIYPKDYIQPLKEEYLLNAPLEPTNEGYALAKILGLKMAEYANKQSDTKFISLMPTNLYGPGDHFDLETSHALSAIIMKVNTAMNDGSYKVNIWGTGKPKREWLYIDDMIDCLIWSMDNLEKTDTFLNVGTGIDISMFDLTTKIIDKFKDVDLDFEIVNQPGKPDGMLEKRLDVSKINDLGWKAKVDLDDGLGRTIKYYLETYGT